MSRLLIVLAAAILFGAQLTAPVEAQGWTCNWDFTGSNPPPSGWGYTHGAATASGYRATYGSGEYYAQLVYNAGGTTFTSISAEFIATTSVAGPRYIASMPAPSSGTVWNGTGTNSTSWTGSASSAEIFIGDYSSSPSNNIWITSMSLAGTGSPPGGCVDSTPTSTPTSTPPPAPTPTNVDPVMFAQSNWSCPFDLRSQLQGWQVITGSYVPGAGIQGAYPSTNQKISVTLPLNSGTTLYDIRLDYDSTTGTETILRADGVAFDDANGMPAGNQIVWWQGNQAFNNSLNIEIIGSLFTPATIYLKNVMLRGYGGAPPCSNSGLPQPTPVPVIVEAGNLWTGLADANNTLNSLGPGSVGSGVPNETGRQLFGYVKWLVSPSSADELAGPFAPLISHTGVFIALLFALILVYAIVWAVIWILRFIYWLYRLIVQIIDLVLQVAQVIGSAVGQVGQLIGGFIGSAIKFLF